jgi:nanoRNase/pAp phosphatase (c-di-AMP/oligoRNAs hydrolase)
MANAPSPREPERPFDPAAPSELRDRLRKLLLVARRHDRAVVLTHDNPDPDAVASACGLAHLLHQCAGVSAIAAYGGIIGRAENKAMLRVLHLPIQPVSKVEVRARDLVCVVHTQR